MIGLRIILVFLLFAAGACLCSGRQAHAAEPQEDVGTALVAARGEILQLKKTLFELRLENLRYQFTSTRDGLEAVKQEIAAAEAKTKKEEPK